MDEMLAGVDLATLERWMDDQEIGRGPIVGARQLSGGTQNILVQFGRGCEEYVLRRPPVAVRENSNETMRREARILQALANSGVPHPRFIASCPDKDVLGAAFYLMAPVDGFNPVPTLPPLHAGDEQVRRRIGLSMVEAIAALGNIDYRAVGLEGFGKPDKYLKRQVGRWRSQLESYGSMAGWPGQGALPGVERVAEWLEEHRPLAFEPGIMHGDFHMANVMVRHDSGDLAAVVDWELCTIGDPLLDLGWMLATWPEGDEPTGADVATMPWAGFARPDELISHYAANSRRNLSSLNWYVILACFKLAIIIEGTFARSCAGLAPRETGIELHEKAIALFSRALRRIGWGN